LILVPAKRYLLTSLLFDPSMTPESKRSRARLIRQEADARSGGIAQTLRQIAAELEEAAAAQERGSSGDQLSPLPAMPSPS
jgi:hypothetical protein